MGVERTRMQSTGLPWHCDIATSIPTSDTSTSTMNGNSGPGRRSVGEVLCASGEKQIAHLLLLPLSKSKRRDKEGGRHDMQHLGDQEMIWAACQSTTMLCVHSQGNPRTTEGTE